MAVMIKEGTLKVQGSDMHYVSFGSGEEPLVIIPGLSDGMKTVKGTGMMMRLGFSSYAKDYRIWIFSRKNELEEGCTTRDMAREQAEAMEQLSITEARVMGISQGGMISQWLAIDYPRLVSKLVILVSLSRQNDTLQKVIGSWIEMAREERYEDLIIDTIEKSFTEKSLKKIKPFYRFLQRAGKSVPQERYLIQANAGLTHDAYRELSEIKCPTLIAGGSDDRIVGGAAVQQEMAAVIPAGRLHLYPGYGHAVFAEAKDFNRRVINFLASAE